MMMTSISRSANRYRRRYSAVGIIPTSHYFSSVYISRIPNIGLILGFFWLCNNEKVTSLWKNALFYESTFSFYLFDKKKIIFFIFVSILKISFLPVIPLIYANSFFCLPHFIFFFDILIAKILNTCHKYFNIIFLSVI